MNSGKTHILADLKELRYRKCCFLGRKHGSVGKKLCHASVRTWTWNLRTYVCNPNTPVVRWEVKVKKLQLLGQLTYCKHRNTSKESGTDTWGYPVNSTYVHVRVHIHTHTAKSKEKENRTSKIEVPQNLTGEFLGLWLFNSLSLYGNNSSHVKYWLSGKDCELWNKYVLPRFQSSLHTRVWYWVSLEDPCVEGFISKSWNHWPLGTKLGERKLSHWGHIIERDVGIQHLRVWCTALVQHMFPSVTLCTANRPPDNGVNQVGLKPWTQINLSPV